MNSIVTPSFAGLQSDGGAEQQPHRHDRRGLPALAGELPAALPLGQRRRTSPARPGVGDLPDGRQRQLLGGPGELHGPHGAEQGVLQILHGECGKTKNKWVFT